MWLSTLAFTVCFAVWAFFSIIGIHIKKDLGLNETTFGLLIATPILSDSLTRLFLGIWADPIWRAAGIDVDDVVRSRGDVNADLGA